MFQITSNILTTHQQFLEKEGKVTVRFKHPPVECLLSLSSPSDQNKGLMKLFVHNLKQTSNGSDFVKVVKEVTVSKLSPAQKFQAATWRILRVGVMFI